MRNRIFSGSVATVAAVALLCLTSPAQAADPPRHHSNDFEFTPFAGFMAGGEFEDPADSSDRDLDEDSNFGLIVNAAADYWRHYEMLYTTQSTRVDGATPFDLDVQYLQFGGIVSYPDASRVIPYFGLTIGAARFSPDAPGFDDETKFAASIAGGVRVPITDHIGVRLDLRAFITALDTEGDLFCVSDAGLTCNIRAKSDTFLQYSAALGVTVGF
jgi:opacity protein-like surface antigen